MNSSLTRTELFAFWYWTEWLSSPSRSMSNPAAARAAGLAFLAGLAPDELADVGVVDVEDDHLGGATGLAPDLIVPADASAPRMKLTGPEAVPPPARNSRELRILERLTPEPEPPLKIVPSSTYQLRIEGIESSTARMNRPTPAGHARHADVEPDRRVESGLLGDDQVLQLVAERRRLDAVGEVAVADTPCGMVSTTRSTTWRSELSRSGEPSGPRKYFWARMFVAFIDQLFGTSTPSCSKATSPVR